MQNGSPAKTGFCTPDPLRPTWTAILLFAALAAGCTGAPEKTYPVEGTVTLDGQPVAGLILFGAIDPAPSGKRYTARGAVDSRGRYELSTFGQGDGAVAGWYEVTVSDLRVGMTNEQDNPEPIIPLKYGSPEQSGLKFEVKPQHNKIDIELHR